MFRSIAILMLCLATLSAQGALLGRGPLTPGGTDYQGYYDDALGITWLADADYARTTGYTEDGRMTWLASLGWLASLNAASHLGVDNWRLPTVVDTDLPGCTGQSFVGTDCGWNVDVSTSEMAHLFHDTLGNSAAYDSDGGWTGCYLNLPNGCLANTGPFSNVAAYGYFSGTTYAPDANDVWMFNFHSGSQYNELKTGENRAWAVTDGDALAVVPIPAAAWLLGSALGASALVRRRGFGT